MACITYLDYYIPEEELSIPNFLDRLSLNSIPPCFKTKPEYALFIDNILKLKSIRVETKLDAAGMIGRLIEKMLNAKVVNAGEIDVVIFAQEPEIIPQRNLAKYLQYTHKMDNAYPINISGNLCANNDIALDIAASLCQTRKNIKNILIASICKIETLEKRLFGTYAVAGDAAGLMLYSSDKSSGKYNLVIPDKVIISDGSFHDVDENVDNSLLHCKSYSKCIMDLLKKNTLKDEHIERILIPNANTLLVSQCLAAAGLKTNKIFLKNIGKYGHMDAVDLVINLKDLLEAESLNKKRYIFSFGTGSTGTYVASLLALN